MESVIYADLYFLINFSMDFLCFFLLSKLLEIKISFLRVFFASALGGIYANAVIILDISAPFGMLLDILFAFFMCAVALCRKKTLRELPANTIVYVAISITLGGFMTVLFNFFNKLSVFAEADNSAVADGDGIEIWGFALIAAICAVVSLICGERFRSRLSLRSAEVIIENKKARTRLRGVVDSGNLLHDPISGKACILVELDSLKGILSDELLGALRRGVTADECILRYGTEEKLRAIPVHTAAGSGMFVGFVPERIYINSEKREKSADAVIVIENVKHPIGRKRSGGSALIPSELLG